MKATHKQEMVREDYQWHPTVRQPAILNLGHPGSPYPIWILRVNHLLTIKPPKEGIRERYLGLASMPRHVINPSLHL